MKTIAFPFRIDGYGNVDNTSNMSRIWADRVRAVISTMYGERIMHIDFGAGLPANLFDVIDEVAETIDGTLSSAFAKWLPGVKYEGTDIIDLVDGEIDINIKYSIPSIDAVNETVYTVTI